MSVRPYVGPGERTTLGPVAPLIPSISHPILGASQQGASDAQHWTPHGILMAVTTAWQARTSRGAGAVTRSPGAWFTAPALWNLTGIPDRNLVLTGSPPFGRSGTPPVRHMAINPFPGVAPPLVTYPLPAAWPGRF